MLGAPLIYGGSEDKIGTAGAPELTIPASSRGAALAGSLLATATGTEAMSWNPAGMVRGIGGRMGIEGLFSSLNYLADIQLNYFALGMQLGSADALGLSLRTFDFGDIPVTTTEQPEGTGGVFSPKFVTVGVSYARAFSDRFYAGITAKLVTESVMNTSAAGIAADVGVQYVVPGGLSVGVALKNVGPKMRLAGEDLTLTSVTLGQNGESNSVRLSGEEFDLPSSLEIGVGYRYELAEENSITLSGAFQNANFGADKIQVGLEYSWREQLFLRTGYVQLDRNNTRNIFGPSVGAGVSLPVGNTTVTFDYAYRHVDLFSANQWFTLKVGF